MEHNYHQVAQELINSAGIDSDEIFYYDDIPLEPVFNLLFQFCQESLRIHSKNFEFEPARFFFRNHMGVNAFATKYNDYYIVGINSGTIVNLYYFFENGADFFDGEQLGFLNLLNNRLTAGNTPLFYLMQQYCTQFTYYHELGHLIQKSPDLQSMIEERYFSPDKKCVYTPERHVYEFDADLYGSEHIAFHILEFWGKQDEEIKTNVNLSYLISTATAAIFSYFLKLMPDNDKIYYAETCHPHPLVRITYIIDIFTQTIEGNKPGKFELSARTIIQDSFKILNVIFPSDGKKQVEVFQRFLLKERDNIEAYMNGNIFSLIDKMPELAYNRVRKK